MIQVVQRDNHCYDIYDFDENIGCVSVYKNPYHNRHSYLNLRLTRYDPLIAAEMFRLLRQKLKHPLQIMLYASQTMHDFLIAGGFERKRRCYELEAHAIDLAAPLQNTVPLVKALEGTAEYDGCCKMLYDYYSKTHRSVSPLTVAAEAFCAELPRIAFCQMEDGVIEHVAFVQLEKGEYEIAYVGTRRLADFNPFAQSLIAELFRECDLITAECDDVDPAAMAMKSLFKLPDRIPYDTYVLGKT